MPPDRAALSSLALDALAEHGDPATAATALVAAAADLLALVLPEPGMAWDALGAVLDAAQADWAQHVSH